MENLFRSALEVIEKVESGQPLSEDERVTYNAALIPLHIFYDDIPIKEALRRMADMLETPPDALRSKFWRVYDENGSFPLISDFRYEGRIAQLVKWPRKSHSCSECREVIEKGEPHYTVVWGGAGLGNIKFPARVHVACLADKLAMALPAALIKELWSSLFDYGYHHTTELHNNKKMYGYVICMQRVWKEVYQNGSKDRILEDKEPRGDTDLSKSRGEGDTAQHLE